MSKQGLLRLILLILISLFVPGLIFGIFFGPLAGIGFNIEVGFLPPLNASINSLTALFLGAGFYFIKKGNWKAHRNCMVTAFILSVLFLISYLIYHTSAAPTHFGGTGMIKYLYYFILITHIILAALIVPLVLITLYKALEQQFNQHKKWARWTWPLWMYVAVTGVLVYLFLYPYY